MAIDTVQKRMSAIHPGMPWRGVLVNAADTGTTQGNRQAAAFLYSGILAGAEAALEFVLDMNTRIAVFLRAEYSIAQGDLTSMIQRYLAGLSGDYTARFQQLQQNATDAMS